jgi:hypothetical protein
VGAGIRHKRLPETHHRRAIQQKHGSRKSGLPQTGKTRRKRGGMGDARQAELFD